MKSLAIFVFLALVRPLLAETEASFYSAGYSGPAPVEVAPGQVVTLFFRGIKPAANGIMRSGQAQNVPVPSSLAGLSIHILQLPQTAPFPVPVFAVRQHNECEEVSGRPICLLTAIRVQIPAELTPTVAKLVVEEDGQPSRTFLLRPVRDNAHIVTSCDRSWDTNPGSVCNRLAFHGDGTMVDEKSPAKLGETIVIYAQGLGPTIPRVMAGHAAPTGAAVIDSVYRQLKTSFIFFRNASPSLPGHFENEPPDSQNSTVYAGLVPEQVGLYQINVRVPVSLDIPVRCGGDTRSNVLAKISTSQGVENVPLCVEP